MHDWPVNIVGVGVKVRGRQIGGTHNREGGYCRDAAKLPERSHDSEYGVAESTKSISTLMLPAVERQARPRTGTIALGRQPSLRVP